MSAPEPIELEAKRGFRGGAPARSAPSDRGGGTGGGAAPQAVLKILGYRSGAAGARATLRYIARAEGPGGERERLRLETNTGERLKGRSAIESLIADWSVAFKASGSFLTFASGSGIAGVQMSGTQEPLGLVVASGAFGPNIRFDLWPGAGCESLVRSTGKRDALHLVISFPEGVGAGRARAILRGTLRDIAGDRPWAFALHRDTAHLHAHALIAMRGPDGRALRTNRQVLAQWRQRLVERARERGIVLAASSRRERGLVSRTRSSQDNWISRWANFWFDEGHQSLDFAVWLMIQKFASRVP